MGIFGKKQDPRKSYDPEFLNAIADALNDKALSVRSGVGLVVGAGTGAAISGGLIYGLGTVGLSGAGLTTGLSTLGTVLGGGMLAGIGVAAAPITILGVTGYALGRKSHQRKKIQNLEKYKK